MTNHEVAVDTLWEEVKGRTWFKMWLAEAQNAEECKQKTKENLRKSLYGNYDDNFLQNLMTDSAVGTRFVGEFVGIMADRPEWKETLERALAADRNQAARNGILHELARCGCCSAVESFLTSENVNVTNGKGETALHFASKNDHDCDVFVLLRAGARVQADNDGFTPLHMAAMSSTPSCRVMQQLVDAVRLQGDNQLFDAATVHGKDTALHVAAGNVNMTEDVIQLLSSANPLARNDDDFTPFHVAVRSENKDILIALLKTFAPAKNGWDIDCVDQMFRKDRLLKHCDSGASSVFDVSIKYAVETLRHKDDQNSPTLLDLCVISGNPEAVALLIQNGADVSRSCLHTIIDESVERPENIDQLKAVYKAIVDNVVVWHCLADKVKLPVKNSDTYNETLRTCMIHLLTHDRKDDLTVIERTIKSGVCDMLLEIFNTPGVFKFPGSKRGEHSSCRNSSSVIYDRYDVTNVIESTVADSNTCSQCKENKNSTVIKTKPYIHSILDDDGNHWRKSGVFNFEPFLSVSEPFSSFAQKLYFIPGLAHLTFMIVFSVHFLDSCCPSRNTTIVDGVGDIPTAWWYVGYVWPGFVVVSYMLFILFLCFTPVRKLYLLLRNRNDDYGVHLKDLWDHFWNFCYTHISRDILGRFLMRLVDICPTTAFCTSLYLWRHRTPVTADNCASYFEAKSLVFLFGFLTVFMLFSGVTRRVYIFEIVLKEIIIKDILASFMLVFVCTVIGFSFALHVLRSTTTQPVSTLPHINSTVYEVFAAALSIGNFYDETVHNPEYYAAGGSLGFYKTVYAFYVTFAAIVLLNVLIAMISSRYEKAKRIATNEWRFKTVGLGTLASAVMYRIFSVIYRIFSVLFRCVHIDGCKLFCFCCCKGRIHYDENLGRYYIEVRRVRTQKRNFDQ